MLRKLATIALTVALLASSASAATIDVLWYTGGVQSGAAGNYEAVLSGLIAQAATAPEITVHNSWSITFWSGGAAPVGGYEALVVASDEGFWDAYPNYTDVVSAVGTSLTLGDRIMVTGQDADYHYINFPGSAPFNGPQGFLIDAINWAGSGSGMGAVFLSPGDVGSMFGLGGLGTYTGGAHGEDVTIPGAYATFPINEGLTTAGLSNWGQSHHDQWSGEDASLWTAINTTSDFGGGAVTLVSAATASAPTTPVPEPGTLALLGLGLAGAGLRFRRKK